MSGSGSRTRPPVPPPPPAPSVNDNMHVADPWWGAAEQVSSEVQGAAQPQASPLGDESPRRRPTKIVRRRLRHKHGHGRRRAKRSAARRSLPLVMLGGAARAIGRRVARSAHLRRIGARGIMVLVVLTAVACSLGVIMLNNVVIARTAELGKLDDRRRELRTEQAIQAAEAARLSAPPRISAYARNKLHMVPATESTYIYLDPANARLQPGRRIRLQRAAEQRKAEQAGLAKPTADAQSASTPPKGATQ